jgi:hypothetical protein
MTRSARLGISTVLTLASLVSVARADGSDPPKPGVAEQGRSDEVGTPTREVTAETLFQEAHEALDDGRVAEACSKLADSQRMDPAGGTVLLLAMCEERNGKLASAWAHYHDALSFARKDARNDRAERALSRIADLEARLPRLHVEVVDPIADLDVRLDGVSLPRSAWGGSMRVDSGSHRIDASAPGRSAWTHSVVLIDGKEERLAVPALPLVTVPAAPAAPAASTQKVASIVLLGAAGVSLVVGTVAGAAALAWDSSADERCADRDCHDRDGVDASVRASSAATVANVALATGFVLAVTGAVLLFTSPSTRTAHAPPSWMTARTFVETGLRF